MLLVLPAAAVAEEIDLEDEVYGGIYSSEFFASGDLDALATAAGGRVTFGGTFHHIHENSTDGLGTWSNTREILNEVWKGRATPVANVGVNGASAAEIAAGTYDEAIQVWASHVEQYLNISDDLPERQVIIAPLPEANGIWVPYGCDPSSFKKAYQRFVDIFRSRGIDETRVRWAFAPNGWSSPGCGSIADYYPGDSSVDVLAFSAYTFGSCFSGSSWAPVRWVVDGPISELTAVNPIKPIIVLQTAAPRSCDGETGGDQAHWVRDLFNLVRAKDNVVGLVWFNIRKVEGGVMMDWRIWDTTWVSPGWSDGIQEADYRWPLTAWFEPGPLTIGLEDGAPPCSITVCDSVGYVDASGEWLLRDALSSEASHQAFLFGDPGDVAFMGDWDGDGTATPGLYRPSNGLVFLRNTLTQGAADVTFSLGSPGDLPLAGDFDGDGKDTVSVYRPSEGKAYVVNELGRDGGVLDAAMTPFYFGDPGDVPFVGDFDGDGVDAIGLHRPSTGAVYLWDSLTEGAWEWSSFRADPGDVIMAGDWDGDGDDTVAVYRPSEQRVYVYLEHDANPAAYALYVGSFPTVTTWDREPAPAPESAPAPAPTPESAPSWWVTATDRFEVARGIADSQDGEVEHNEVEPPRWPRRKFAIAPD